MFEQTSVHNVMHFILWKNPLLLVTSSGSLIEDPFRKGLIISRNAWIGITSSQLRASRAQSPKTFPCSGPHLNQLRPLVGCSKGIETSCVRYASPVEEVVGYLSKT